MKIRSKLFVLLVSLTLTSLLAASFVSINILSADTIRDIRSDLEHDSANLMNRISINTSNRISDITFLGHSINVFLNQSTLETNLRVMEPSTSRSGFKIVMFIPTARPDLGTIFKSSLRSEKQSPPSK